MTLRVRNIDHVTIVVNDLQKSCRFYVDVLGMREVPRPPFSFDGLWFQAGQTCIHMNQANEGSGRAGLPSQGAQFVSRGHHIAFAVEDAQTALDHCHQRKISIAYGPATRPDGAIQFYVRDPDGHLIELFSLPR